jgi:AcrR family transcriptional regulator
MASVADGPRSAQEIRIIHAADRLIAQHGYKRTTMDRVAREAGCAKGTPYIYFRSKEELVLSVLDSHIQATFVRLRQIAATRRPARVRLERMATTRVLDRLDRFSRYGGVLYELLAAVRLGLLRQREQQLHEEALIFVPVLRDVAHTPTTRLMAVARGILFSTNSLLPYYLSADEMRARKVIAARTREVVALVVAGAIVTLSPLELSTF